MTKARKLPPGDVADRDLEAWLGWINVFGIDWKRTGKTKKECAKILKAEFDKRADDEIQKLLLPGCICPERK